MNEEIDRTERVRAVVLAVVMVISVVGGAATIAGQTVADGSLEDTTDDATTSVESAPDGTTEDGAGDETVDAATDGVSTETADGDTGVDGESTETSVDDATDTTNTDVDETTGTDVDDAADTVDDTTDGGDDGTTDTDADVDDATEADVEGPVDETGDPDADRVTRVDTGELVDTTLRDSSGLGGVRLVEVAERLGLDSNLLTRRTTSASTSSTAATRDDTSGSTGADADPDVVNITASAANQPPIYAAGQGPTALTLAEDDPGSFPDNGTATLRLPEDTSTAFDRANTSATASGDGASATVTGVTARQVTISVSSTDDSVNSSISVEGLRFTSGADAQSVDVVWSFGNVSDSTTVGPERMAALGFVVDAPRGARRAPERGTGLSIEPGTRTEGFHGADEPIVISVPDRLRDEVAFDTSADVDVTTRGDDCDTVGPLPPLEEVEGLGYTVNGTEIRIVPGCEIGHDENVFIQDVRFNLSGANASEPAEITAQLETTYEPVDATERASIAAGDPIDGHAPVVDVSTTMVEQSAEDTAGDGAVRISIADDIGGLMADSSRITIELTDTGVTFNESRTLEVASVGDSPPPTVVSANATTLVLEVDGATAEGDEFRIQRSGGHPIRFDAAADASDTSLLVTTTPGAEDVTQTTGTVVSVPQQERLTVPRAIAGDDDRIDNPEIAEAIDLWRAGEEVPGTCDETISNPQISELKDTWRTAGTVNES